MQTSWKNSPEVFTQILRSHGLAPDAVDNVGAAWAAFQVFAQVAFAGVEPAEEDGDGFVVQWGQWSWNDCRPALCFTRQFAVCDVGDDRDGEFWQPQMWAVELQMLFADHAAWSGLDEMAWTNSMGFDFDPIGPERAPPLWRGSPPSSKRFRRSARCGERLRPAADSPSTVRAEPERAGACQRLSLPGAGKLGGKRG